VAKDEGTATLFLMHRAHLKNQTAVIS